MKKVAFITGSLSRGGTQLSLVQLINNIEGDYDISILLEKKESSLFPSINKKVRITYLTDIGKGITPRTFIKSALNNKNIINVVRGLIIYTRFLLNKNTIMLHNFFLSNYSTLDEEFDIAIAYAGGLRNTTLFTLDKIRAKKKVMWVHEDFTTLSNEEKKLGKTIFKKFDKIFCVSEGSKIRFLELYPELLNKVEVFYSIFDSKDWIEKAEAKTNIDFINSEEINLLTVGRLADEKGQDLIPEVVSMLRDEGYSFKWYIIGDGYKKKWLVNEMKKRKIEDHLILLGDKENPYPFYKQCDIYVQTSRKEGYCISMAEALTFDKPIVATNFLTAKEFITHENDGLIADINSQSIFENVKRLMDDKELINKIKKNVKKKSIDTKSEIIKFYNL